MKTKTGSNLFPDIRRARVILTAIGALGLWLGFPNNFLDAPPLILLWPLCVGLLGVSQPSPAKAFGAGWLCTFIGASASLYWLYMPVSNVGGLPILLAALCALLISGCIAIQSGVFALLARSARKLAPWRFAIILPLCWYLLDLAFAWALGFPWLQLSGALAVWPIMLQHGQIAGAWLGGALWLIPCFLIALAPGGKSWLFRTGFALAICAALLGYGANRLMTPPKAGNEEKITAILVEGNIDQNQKWIPEFQQHNVDLYTGMTSEAVEEARKAGISQPLVIWPETAMPLFFERSPGFAAQILDCVRQNDCLLLFGAPGVEVDSATGKDAVFNRAFLASPDDGIIGHYDKRRLVPFGEYAPQWLDWKFLEALLQGVGIYSKGQSSKPLFHGRLALGILICYEGIFPWLALQEVEEGANILVDISNDGWFGDSPAARQHLYLTAGRSIEQDRWLLRATNTGISAVIDSRGRIAVQGGLFVRESLSVEARLATGRTIYNQIAGWLPLIAFALICMLASPALLCRSERQCAI